MSEEQEKQDSQKTLVAFVAGLLIGGLLVWVFGGTPQGETNGNGTDSDTQTEETPSEDGDDEAETDTETDTEDNNADTDSDNNGADTTNETTSERPEMQTGEGSVEVSDQPAGTTVTLESATFPSAEGWIGVRSFPNGQLGSILGAARYSEEQGLIPTEVPLLVPTIEGRTYAVTFFTEDGDRVFDPAYDVQMDTEITTFEAQ